jgi:very-short-patch-repair endonuclease
MEPTDVLDLAERQHAHVATYQLRDLGMSRQSIWRMRRSDAWQAVTSQVLVRRGAPPTFPGRLMAAVLDGGPAAFLSVAAGATYWKLSGFGMLHLRQIDVSRPRGGSRRPSALARVHEVRDLGPGHVLVLDGIPVSSPARVVFELAACLRLDRAERACDSALAKNLTTIPLLRQMLDEWADRGRAGTVAMREILERRPLGYVPPATNLESRFRYLAEKHGLGSFRRQVDLGGEEWVGRVDFLSERCPLVVEVQSEEHHAALVDELADARRFKLLGDAGFRVEPVWDHELWGDYGPAMQRIRRAQAELLAA